MPATRARAAFTLVELLVVVAIIGLLIAIIIPTLGGASEQSKSTVCASRLKSIGTALRSYLNDHDNRLPQVWLRGAPPVSPAEVVLPEQGQSTMVGALFAGTYGAVNAFGIDEVGPSRRPLNSHLGVTNAPDEPPPPGTETLGDALFAVEAVMDPSDRGMTHPDLDGLVPPEHVAAKDRRYTLLGTSYMLNEFALSDDPSPLVQETSTLIPQDFNADGSQVNGGRVPNVSDPARTILAGDGPIDNYHKRIDRRQHWHFSGESLKASRNPIGGTSPTGYVEANMLFFDMHVGTRLKVREPDYADPDVVQKMNTTPDYTFLPEPDWLPTAPTP